MTWIVELPLESYPAELPAKLDASGQYSFATAGAMMWLSQLAYESCDKKIEDILRRWGLARTAMLQSDATKTRGFVAAGWGGTITAFAGTDPLVPRNWLTNVDAFRIADVHAGFAAAVASVAPQLRQAIDRRDDAARPLFFTGHSLGGALAVVAASQLKHVDVAAVYTFGMPRCGGEQFVSGYNDLQARTYRLVHGDDIVPTLPPSEGGFLHVGRLLSSPHGGSFDPTAQPDTTLNNEPVLTATLLAGFKDLLGYVNDVVLPGATQPGLLGEALRFLPPAFGDHIQSQYLQALGVPALSG